MADPDPRQRVEQFERVCRAHGLPITVQRRAVFEAMLARPDHPTADTIYDQIRERVPGISRTTVYRILDTFVRLGLIAKICHPGSAARFDAKTRQHHHLVCMYCESVIDVEAENLQHVPWPDVRDVGFEIRDYHIHFRGVCRNCRQQHAAADSEAAGHSDAPAASGKATAKKAGPTRGRSNKPREQR